MHARVSKYVARSFRSFYIEQESAILYSEAPEVYEPDLLSAANAEDNNTCKLCTVTASDAHLKARSLK
jgi:hypothetical protein